MNFIDRVILEWSYRTKKGYPDLNNEEDLRVFESMFGFNLLEADYKVLSFADLKKYGGPRLRDLHRHIQEKIPVSLITGQEEVIEFAKPEYAPLFSESDIEGIKQLAGARVNNFPFFKLNGKDLSINDLAKSPAFGGRGKGTGTAKEDIALAGINSELEKLGTIDVELAGRLYKGIKKATTVRGTPKADFTLNDETGPVIFISHKDGRTAKDFQQYSGFKGLEDYEEIQSFVEDVREVTNGELQPKQAFKRPLNSEEIKRKSVYGLNFGAEEFGINNCQAILQGPVLFELQDTGEYIITCNHQVYSPNIPSDSYEPMLYVTFRRDRKNMGILNARFGIYPTSYAPKATDI